VRSRPGARWPGKAGPLLRKVSTGDGIGDTARHPDAIRGIRAHRIAMAGIVVDRFDPLSAHALRVGFTTEAYGKRVRDEDIMRHTPSSRLANGARLAPEHAFGSVEVEPALDFTELLWVSLALSDEEESPDTTVIYQPAPLQLHTVAEARAHPVQRLKDQPDGVALDSFCPARLPTPASRRAIPIAARRLARDLCRWSGTGEAGGGGDGAGGGFEPTDVASAWGHSPS
jgi:hypothetical protein